MGFAAQDRGLLIALFITQHSLVPSCLSQLRPDRGFLITQISPLGPQNRPETYCYRISIRRLSKSILFNRNLKENRWFFDPQPLLCFSAACSIHTSAACSKALMITTLGEWNSLFTSACNQLFISLFAQAICMKSRFA